VLNNAPPSVVGLDPPPWLAGDLGRSLVLLVDESAANATETTLLRTLRDRPIAHIYMPEHGSSPTWRFGRPNHGRDFLPVALSPDADAPVRGLAAPALASTEARAKHISADVPYTENEVFRLLMLAGLTRTNRGIDGVVVARSVLDREPLAKLLAPRIYMVSEAVALLGLALRAHGDHVIARDGNTTFVTSGEAFYRAVAHRHLWSLPPWIRTAGAHWLQSSHEPMTRLNGVVRRVTRALRARDYLQVRLRAPQFESVWDEVMFFLDVVLVEMMGAFDVLGRFFHHLYEIHHAGSISWRQRRNKGWMTALERKEPQLGFYAQPGQPFADVVDAIAVLRNLIHDAPPTDEIHDWDGSPGTMVYGPGVIALPSGADTSTLLNSAVRQHGLGAWGLSDRPDDNSVLLDPGLFTEQSLRLGTKVIAEALALADRSRLGEEEIDDVSHWIPSENCQANAAALYRLQRGGLRQERVTFG
jgi:hypothetical protein